MNASSWDVIRERINKRQDALNISNYRIAKDIGVSQSTVSRIRSGENIPSVEVYLKYLAAIGMKSIVLNI